MSPGIPYAGAGSQRSAFTLIELMVVVALIGIMTAMILPEMKGTYEDALLRSTSRELLDAVSVAHSRAVSFNQQHRLRVETSSGEYFIEKRRRERGGEQFVLVDDVSGGSGKLDTRIALTLRTPGEEVSEETTRSSREVARQEVINFYSDGTADAREVLLKDRQGFQLALRINPTTARVQVVERAPQ